MNKLICQMTRTQKWLNLLLALGLFSFHHAHKIILRQQEREKSPIIGYRLPLHVTPTNYKLRLWPNATSMTFRGTVDIELSVYNPTNNVTLHAHKLTIESVCLENFFFEEIAVSTESIADDRQLLIIKSKTVIPDGRYVLKIYFSGSLDGREGLYVVNPKTDRTMVVNKFEPTYARQAFPCFDEPGFKATFDLTIIKPQSDVVISNMNEVSKTLDNDTGSEAVKFATSVPMSTYLVAFVIGKLAFKETEINANGIGNNFTLRCFAQEHEIHKLDFALDIGKRATEFYLNYFEVPFPLPKLDMIAIPNAALGAVEQWGLIIYPDGDILIDETTTSIESKIRAGLLVAHEVTHMWFGNLVTMVWWNEIWLKEGFATYIAAKSINAIEPSWTVRDDYTLDGIQHSLSGDAKLSIRPIVQTDVNTPGQIMAMFDTISYTKGASILRMLESLIGEENFRKGLSDYLNKHKFGNTVAQDLYASLDPYFKKDYPKQNLTYIIETWTKQKGYPLLTVVKEADTYLITQSRFLLDPQAVSPDDSEFGYCWVVPITFKTNKGVNKKVVWFEDTTESVTITEKNVKWIKINNDQVGYYRVNYPLEMWQDLIEQLKLKSNIVRLDLFIINYVN